MSYSRIAEGSELSRMGGKHRETRPPPRAHRQPLVPRCSRLPVCMIDVMLSYGAFAEALPSCMALTDTPDLASSRWAVLRTIEQLDPERDHQRIVHLSFGYEFPWDSIRALEIALYRTYCVPSISALLDRTGEFHHDTQRRYDDTSILVAEMCEWGYEKRPRQGSARADELGARPLQDRERRLPLRALDVHLRAGPMDRRGSAGARRAPTSGSATTASGARSASAWASPTSPPSYEAFEAWSRDYERRHFRFAETNQRVGSSTRDLFASWFPRLLTPVVRYGIYAMLDDDMIAAFGFPEAAAADPPVAAGRPEGARPGGALVAAAPASRTSSPTIGTGRIPAATGSPSSARRSWSPPSGGAPSERHRVVTTCRVNDHRHRLWRRALRNAYGLAGLIARVAASARRSSNADRMSVTAV